MVDGTMLDDLLLGGDGMDLVDQSLDPSWLDALVPPDVPADAPDVVENVNTLGALLAYSCEVECVENVLALLKQGANPNVAFHNGKTALEWASSKQNDVIVGHLLRHGAATVGTSSHDQRRWTAPTVPAPPPVPSPPRPAAFPSASSTPPSTEANESWKIPARKFIKRPVATSEKRLESLRGLYNYERRPTDPRDKSRPRSDAAAATKSPHASSSLSQPSVSRLLPASVPPPSTNHLRSTSVHRSKSKSTARPPASPDPVLHPHLYRSKSRPRSPSPLGTPFSRRLRSHSHARPHPTSPERTIPYHPSMDMCVLYVGNLHHDVSDAAVRRQFKHCGDVRYFKRGFAPPWGHITFATAQEAVKALSLNGQLLMERPMVVRLGDRCNPELAADVNKLLKKQRRKEEVDDDDDARRRRRRRRSDDHDDRRGRSPARRTSRRSRSPERWEHDLFEDKPRVSKSKSESMRRGSSSRRHDSRSRSRPRKKADRSDRRRSSPAKTSHRHHHRDDRSKSRGPSDKRTYSDRHKSQYGPSSPRTKKPPERRDRSKTRQDHRSKSQYRSPHNEQHGGPMFPPLSTTQSRLRPSTHQPAARSTRGASVHRPDVSASTTSRPGAHRHANNRRSHALPSRSPRDVPSHPRHPPPPPSDVVDLSMSSPEDNDERCYLPPRNRSTQSILRRPSVREDPRGHRSKSSVSQHHGGGGSGGHMQRHRSMSQHTSHRAHHPSSSYGPQHSRPSTPLRPSRAAPSPSRDDPFRAFEANKRPRPPSEDDDSFSIPKRPRSSSTAPTRCSRFNVQVTNVSKRASTDALRRMFGICGPLLAFHRDVSPTGVPQPLVRISYEFREALQKALELDGLKLYGRAIRVQLS
ncbi:hypothetical protein H257_03149 [Aphanomyces astaci]|uniref:RRM domain-containing protein n=1 Tax=Aphanomyces astaci TaxID=112090 RepID=W4H1E3_APHAT|nr:hypothetical protein H257_03149 [Aphanomyces astaci]ETV85406.1 hypothetical protein H257_03149 [Aphanomyces astaci]RQM19540.1 hypothetical protein B5M09_005814 [Aphanomyces astaci]|eukprot:XP_009825424.1 hypothetical protein H257_03149 [Aphanomyces astaci]